MALVRGSNFRLIAHPVLSLGPTYALFAALLCWFDLVGVRVFCVQGGGLRLVRCASVARCSSPSRRANHSAIVRFVRYLMRIYF
jgi:hypothetical protein